MAVGATPFDLFYGYKCNLADGILNTNSMGCKRTQLDKGMNRQKESN